MALNHRCSEIVAGLALVTVASCAGSRNKTVAPQAGTALPRSVIEAPGDAPRLCSGHISGAPLPDGKPGPHILWEAYSSQELPASLAKRYLDSLGSEAHSTLDGCDLWRFPPDKPARTLEVCPVSVKGPWSECDQAPPRAATIIMISSMATAD